MFQARFWGVRGSIACPTPSHIRYGGNTSCVEINCDDFRILLDAGTGLRQAGAEILKNQADGKNEVILFLSHTHWDHINGFPFFAPAYMVGYSLRVFAGHVKTPGGIRAVLYSQMTQPYFPVPLETMQSRLSFEDFEAGDQYTLNKGKILIKTTPLNHPNGATGYRIEYKNKSICYITDTEHVIDRPDTFILELIDSADLVIYDCTYTDQEFEQKVGWGHSTWQEGVRLCREAGAKRLAIFHHDPEHTDDFMDSVYENANQEWMHAFVAREGDEVRVD